MKASDIQLGGKTSFLFKSSPGFGKTLAALSFALDGPVFLSYWDKSQPVEIKTFFTEKRFGSLAKRIIQNIEYEVYGSTTANKCLNKLIDLSHRCDYFAYVNDSITMMTAGAVNWSLNFGKSGESKKGVKDVLPDWNEYKVETSLVSQCMDICRELPCHVIWTAHPLSTVSLSGSGSSMKVVRTNPLVSYGSKVASMVPGSFTEIYHFSQKQDWNVQGGAKKYIVNTEAVGDEFAKSPLLGDYVKEFDITDKLFYQVWKQLIAEKTASMILPDVIVIESSHQIQNPFPKDKPEQSQQSQQPPVENSSKWKV